MSYGLGIKMIITWHPLFTTMEQHNGIHVKEARFNAEQWRSMKQVAHAIYANCKKIFQNKDYILNKTDYL